MITSTTESTPQDFRLYLQSILITRCQRNPRYSLRAFASSLGVDHSTLSQIIRGKRAIGPRMRLKLSDRLGLGPDEQKRLFVSRPETEKDYYQMTLDAFIATSDWYYYGILQLMRVKDFQQDVNWIARRLGVTPSEINIAVERFTRLGILEVDGNGKWVDRTEGHTTNIGQPLTSIAHRKLQKQFLEKAVVALEEVPFEKRHNSGMTMAIDSSKLDQVHDLIQEFRRRISEFLETGDSHDQVYQFTISLFPLSQISQEKSNESNQLH